jgi:hypothetical protein
MGFDPTPVACRDTLAGGGPLRTAGEFRILPRSDGRLPARALVEGIFLVRRVGSDRGRFQPVIDGHEDLSLDDPCQRDGVLDGESGISKANSTASPVKYGVPAGRDDSSDRIWSLEIIK